VGLKNARRRARRHYTLGQASQGDLELQRLQDLGCEDSSESPEAQLRAEEQQGTQWPLPPPPDPRLEKRRRRARSSSPTVVVQRKVKREHSGKVKRERTGKAKSEPADLVKNETAPKVKLVPAARAKHPNRKVRVWTESRRHGNSSEGGSSEDRP
jgi:hypothetical protein